MGHAARSNPRSFEGPVIKVAVDGKRPMFLKSSKDPRRVLEARVDRFFDAFPAWTFYDEYCRMARLDANERAWLDNRMPLRLIDSRDEHQRVLALKGQA